MDENSNLKISFGIVGVVSVLVFGYLFFSSQQERAAQERSSVSREEWTTGVKALIPSTLCPSFGYFLNCFELEPSECRRRAVEVSHKCVDTIKIEIPEKLKLPDDGRRYGLRIAQCVERSFEFQIRDRKREREDCVDPALFSSRNPAPTVTKAEFMMTLEGELPESICHPQSFFRLCYLVSDEDCRNQAKTATDSCLAQLEPTIPGALKEQIETSVFGAAVGTCVGHQLERFFERERMGQCRPQPESTQSP